MSNPINQIVSKEYAQFNQIFEAARRESRPAEFQKYVNSLLSLQQDIESAAKKASELPGKITFAELSSALSAKITTLFDDIKGAPIPPTPPKPLRPCLTQCVGFGNKSANCWANALLQVLLHSPERTDVLRTVGKYYAESGNLDMARLDKVVRHFHGGPISDKRFTDGEILFKAITSSYQKLQALDQLIEEGEGDDRVALASRLLKHLPDIYPERVAKLQGEIGNLKGAIKALLSSEKDAESRRQINLKASGEAFLAAEQHYRNTVAMAMQSGQIPAGIPTNVSQNVRLAFHHLFGTYNDITHQHVFSPLPGAHEDADEARQRLTGRYEEILKAQNKALPATHSLLESRRIYAPHGEPRALNPTKIYSALENRNTTRERSNDYQIFLQPPIENDHPVEDLLAGYFRSPPVAGSDNPVFLSADGLHEQSYRILEEQRSFVGEAPRLLTLVIKRFGMRIDGSTYKIQTRVMANRVITLPADGVETEGPARPRAYELESFFVHRGTISFGHYVAYRKIEGTWVEFDDSRVRTLTEAQVDDILHGATPYALDYRLVPPERQDTMLLLSQTLRTPRAPQSEPAPGASPHQKVIDHLTKLQALLNGSAKDKEIVEAIDFINTLSPICYKQLCILIGIVEGKEATYGEKVLHTQPRILSSINESWIRVSSGGIMAQLIQNEKEKMAIRKCMDELNSIKEIYSKLKLQKDADSLAKKQNELEQLIKRYRMENLGAFHTLLKNDFITNDQINAIFKDLDISDTLKKRIYERIEELTESPKGTGEKQFLADPRILLRSPKKEKEYLDFDDDDALSSLFADLSLTTKPTSSSILEEIIDSLRK